ncbi:MAG: GSCFA domain-containing protein [Muribaculaceae bacterium]|nr:GSCFA domain-containing protein [Muribaculaceae bacterium]
MKFRTELTPSPSRRKIDPRGRVLLLGSCFSENIGRKMAESRWNVTVNPTGVLFNPASIAITLTAAMLPAAQRQSLLQHTLTERDGAWVSWLSDASTAGLTPAECFEKCMAGFDNLREALLEADTVILTWGTAFMYSLNEGGPEMVVANCHKHPASEFTRRRASVGEIADTTSRIVNALRTVRPDLRIIITVSPVRHLADGAAENSRSKATLLLAAEQLCEILEDVEYFPSFELMNDDLRDYRFYAADLCHPSEEGVEYIWEKFRDCYLSDKGRELSERGAELTRREHHRSQIPGSKSDIRFREETERLLKEWESNKAH